MHQILKFFLSYRANTDYEVSLVSSLQTKLRDTEVAFAQKTPVNEAEYAFDERTPLLLYDCLLPKLKEHRKFKVLDSVKFVQYLIDDYKNKREALEAELKIKNYHARIYELETENKRLRQEVSQKHNEISVVDWYLEIMEAG